MERSCRQSVFFFIRSLDALSGHLPPGMSAGQPSERSCRQLVFLIHPITSCFFWRSASWNVTRTAFGTVLSTGTIFIHQTASCFLWTSAAWNIGRTALETILLTVVLFFHQMCHDHEAHVFSTTIRQKKQGILCQRKQGRLGRKK